MTMLPKAGNPLIKIVAFLTFAVGILVFIFYPKNKYEWMQEIDRSISTLPEDNSSDQRWIFFLIVLIVILIAQTIFFARSAKKSDKFIAAAFATTALVVWAIKYFVL